ncbi:MAG TPA: hypothetical protein VN894_12165 [Polyangiaceae bacterium]|nr:hypothetical protein [Polyangiaceae bacterium]
MRVTQLAVRIQHVFLLLSPPLVGCGNVAELLGILVTDAGSGHLEPDDVAAANGQVDAAADVEAAAGPEAGADPEAGIDRGDAGSTCDFSMPFGVPVLLGALESNASEGGFRLLPDELTGFFWSSRGIGPGSTNLYVTTRPDTGAPFAFIKLLNNVNLPMSLTIDPTVTADGLTLVFRGRTGKSDAGIDELYSTARTDAGSDFPAGTRVTNLNSTANTVQPFILPDGSEVYFSSNRAGTFDLYRAARSGGTFGAPVAVTELNVAAANQGDPVLSTDDLTILFSSTRIGGLGKDDIWMAQRASKTEPFAAPIDLREVNSGGIDAPTWLSPDGCRLYLSSDRDGAVHLYLATRQ